MVKSPSWPQSGTVPFCRCLALQHTSWRIRAATNAERRSAIEFRGQIVHLLADLHGFLDIRRKHRLIVPLEKLAIERLLCFTQSNIDGEYFTELEYGY